MNKQIKQNCSLIAVVDNNLGIGRAGDQLAYISEDLKRFKKLTSGKCVVMGRKTFEALPKGALPNRRNIILSKNDSLYYPNTEIVGSVEDTFNLLKNETEFFVIGGGEIYKLFMPFASRIYLTTIYYNFENVDTFFPSLELENWELVSREGIFQDQKSDLFYSFRDFLKR